MAKRPFHVVHYGYNINAWTSAYSQKQALRNVLNKLKRMDLYPKMLGMLDKVVIEEDRPEAKKEELKIKKREQRIVQKLLF